MSLERRTSPTIPSSARASIGLFVGSLTSLWRAPAGDPDARLEAVVVALGDRISVKRSERNYIADVEVRAATPAKAEHLAQGLADAFFAEQAALSDQVVAKQSAWLDARIAELQPRAEEAERRAPGLSRSQRDRVERRTHLA